MAKRPTSEQSDGLRGDRRLRGLSSGLRRQSGFTLIELGLVILIIGVMLAITVPRIGNRSYAQLGSEARKLALAFRYLRHSAILNGRPYRLVYDLENQAYWAEVGEVAAPPPLEEEDAEDEGFLYGEQQFDEPVVQFARDTDGAIERRKLPEPIGISDVNLPFVTGKVFEGPVWTTFYPDGYVDISVVHLDNGQDVYTMYVLDSITGQVFVEPGYLSWSE